VSQAYKYSPNQDSSQFKSAVYEMDELGGPVVWDYRPDCEECNPPSYANAGQADDEDCFGCAVEERAQQLYNVA